VLQIHGDLMDEEIMAKTKGVVNEEEDQHSKTITLFIITRLSVSLDTLNFFLLVFYF
jgi:hypothetical protein